MWVVKGEVIPAKESEGAPGGCGCLPQGIREALGDQVQLHIELGEAKAGLGRPSTGYAQVQGGQKLGGSVGHECRKASGIYHSDLFTFLAGPH